METMSTSLEVVTPFEETCLILGIYFIGPISTGIAILFLISIMRSIFTADTSIKELRSSRDHFIRDEQQRSSSSSSSTTIASSMSLMFRTNREYWFASCSMFFTILLNISYGTYSSME